MWFDVLEDAMRRLGTDGGWMGLGEVERELEQSGFWVEHRPGMGQQARSAMVRAILNSGGEWVRVGGRYCLLAGASVDDLLSVIAWQAEALQGARAELEHLKKGATA